jgi:hypothetical protein
MENKSIWRQTRKILLIIAYDSLDQVHTYRDAIKSVGLNVNDSLVLALVDTKKEVQILTPIHSVVYASEKEINWLGKWRNNELQKHQSRSYDLLIIVGEFSAKVHKQLRRMHNGIFLGINSNADFLTIDLKSDNNSPDHLLNFAKETLEKIN